MRYIIIKSSFESKEEANKLALTLVQTKLAACVQLIGPVTSIYRWQNTCEKSTEWQCEIKTKATLYDKVKETILQTHTYDTPEIIVIPFNQGHNDYLEWIEKETI
jgi:periplasmic divalent cation tolerance protein